MYLIMLSYIQVYRHYRLENRGVVVQFPTGANSSSLLLSFQTSCEAHRISY